MLARRLAAAARPLARDPRVAGALRHRSDGDPAVLGLPDAAAAAEAAAAAAAAARRAAHKDFKRALARGRGADADAALAALEAAGGVGRRHLVHGLLALHARAHRPARAVAALRLLGRPGHPDGPNAHSFALAIGALKAAPPARAGGGPPLAPAAACEALALLEEMLASPDLAPLPPGLAAAAWNSVLNAHAKAGLLEETLALYARAEPVLAAAGAAGLPRTASILMTACRVARQPRRARGVFDSLVVPAAGTRSPGVAAWNGLLAASGPAGGGSLDAAYEVWQEMVRRRVAPDSHTQRALAAAFGGNPAMAGELVAEARALAAEIAAEGGGGGGGGGGAAEGSGADGAAEGPSAPSRQLPLRLDAVRRGAPSAAQLGLASGADGFEHGSDGGANADAHDGALPPRELLFLDLHGHSQAAAAMAALRRLDALAERWPAVEATARAATEAAGGEPEGLILVTGQGRGAGVLGRAVAAALAARGLAAAPPPGNPGRLVAPFPAIAAWAAAQRGAAARERVFGAARARYALGALGVAAFAGIAIIVPRLAPWL
jgi:hypothetical protein